MRNRAASGLLPAAVLLACALVWGSTFPAIRLALEHSTPVLLTGLRFVVATLVLLPWLGLTLATASRATLLRGMALGALLAVGFSLQAVGLTTTGSGRSAFLTSTYVLLTPLLEWAWFRSRPSARALGAACVALAGIALMTGPALGREGLTPGDLFTLAAAVAFAGQIVMLHRALQRDRARALLSLQVAGCAAMALFLTPLTETPRLDPVAPLLAMLAFLGIVATAAVLGMQAWGQRRIGPSPAALLFSSEPVWAAVLAGALGERMTPAELAGGAVLLAGVIAGTWPARPDRPLQRGQSERSSISPR